METFKKLNNHIILTYLSYLRAYQWDKYKLCFSNTIEPVQNIIQDDSYGLFLNHHLIGYGTIMPIEEELFSHIPNATWFKNSIHLEPGIHKAELAFIIHPKYQHCGYGKKFLNYMEEEARKEYDSAVAWLYKKNRRSLSLIEKSEFDFKSFNDDIIIFEKKLK